MKLAFFALPLPALLLLWLFACKTSASRESFPFEDVSKQTGIDFWQYSGATGEMPMSPTFFINNGNGTFTDVTARAGVASSGWSTSAAFITKKGSLEAGKLADFIVIDRDPLSAPSSERKDIQVLSTWVGGELMYQSR